MQTFLQKIFVVVLLGLPAFCAFANTQYLYFDAKDAQTPNRLLSTQKHRLGISNNDEFRWSQTNTDDLGLSHQIYQQFYHNYRVENAVLKTHSRNNVLYLANGNWVRNLTQTPNIALTETQALARALQQVKATKYAWEDEATEKIAQQLANNPNATFYPTAELVWATEGFTARATDYRLCYRFDVFALQPMQRYYVYVDAQTGNIVTKTSLIHHSDTPCTGTASYACSNPVSIMAKKIGPKYYLSEDGNNGNTRRISTYSAQNNNSYLPTEVSSTDNVFNEDPAAVATHWATEKTYDYFKNTHGRNSFDNNNARMINFCHYDDDPADGMGYDNAFWNGSFLTYGNGNMYPPLVSIDVVAHEITHAITQYTAGLTYTYEAGALNESFSDIFGTIVEFYADGTCANWLLGEDLTSGGLRNMQNPNAKQQPDTYHGNYWYAGSNDYGGVHTNSGVQNYWFYLLANGGSGTNDQGTNYSVQALGMDKAAKITYRSLAVYLDATANYADARTASLQAAQDLLNAGQLTLAELQQVANAWCAVGVGTCTLSNGTIALATPNGGETYQVNDSQNIMWTSTGTLNAIDISYSIDGGNTWTFIANTPNTGSYTWAVPNISTTLAQIQVRDQYNSAITDQSNNNFSIQGCDIQAGFIADTTTACAGTTLNFTNTTTGASSYVWQINGTTQSTDTNFSYLFATAGTHTLSLLATQNNCTDSYSQTITINPSPNTPFTYSILNNKVDFFAPLNNATYYWDFGDGQVSTAQNPIHSYFRTDTYLVCLTSTNVCGTATECQNVSPITTCQDTWTQYTANSNNVLAIAEEGNYLWIGIYGGGLIHLNKNTGNKVFYNTANSKLPNNNVYAIAIDAQGNKWIGTWGGGLAKFDGTTWTTYTMANSGLRNDWVTTIAIDAQGNKWIGTYDGLTKFDGTTWTTNYSNSGSPNNYVYAITIDSQGNKWIGIGNGLVKFDDTTWTGCNNSGFLNSVVYSITIDAQGNKWIGTSSGLAKFDGTNWTTYNTANSGLPTNSVDAIAIDSQGNKWIGTSGYGLVKFDGTTWTTYNTSNSGLLYDNVQAITIDAQDNKWIGTYGELAKFDGTNWTTYDTNNSGLPNNIVNTIAIDAQGNKWIGTYNGGVANFDGTTWTTYNTTNSGLPGNNVKAIAIDAQGNKWIGTCCEDYNGGVAKFDGTNWTTYNNYNSGGGLPNNWVNAIAIDAQGNKWIGTWGLTKFDDTTWTTYNTNNSGLPDNNVYSITIDAQGNKWIGTYGGLAKFDGTNWTTYNTTNSGLPSNYVASIAIDAQGNKWIGTGSGLAKFDGTNWTIYTTANSGLPNNGAGSITIDAQGNKWIGTNSGLAKFDGTTWIIYNTTNSGLSDYGAGTITIDAQANKWIGTGYGISVLGNCTTAPTPCTITSNFTAPATNLCTNTPYTFTNTSAGGATTYQWRINGANVSTAANLNYTFTTAGTYSIALVASNGSCSNTYSQNVSINPAATQLALGSNINHCSDEVALMLDCQISNATAYTWQLNGTNIDTTQTLNVTQSGTYSLTVTDACGSTATDAVQVFIDTDCVYPGDLNHDNIVNYLDLLPMGLANGATGIARPNASPNFEGQPCPNWSGTQDNGSNYKHLDGNGDGIISASDANLITANYGQTHGVFTPPTFSGGGITSLSAQMDAPPTTFGIHTTIAIDLYLNNNINGNVTAYGAAFKVNYQFPNCVKVNNAYIDFTGSWLGTLGTDMTAVQRNKISNNQKSGNIEVSLTRLDHTNRSNYGKIGTLIADVDLVGTIDGALLSVLFSNQQLVISNGTFVPMGIVNSSFTIPNPIYPAVSLNSTALSGLLPCSGTAVTLTAAVSNCNSCTYVWKKGANVIASATTATINTTQAGTYTVIVTNANGSSSASVVLSVNQACAGSTGVAYCSPSITTTSAEWIKSVQFGTIDAPNITTSSPNGYGNYVDSKVFTLVPGTPATLTLQPDFSGSFKTEYWTVYADRNRDGDFDDLGELIWQKTTTDNQAFSKTYNIPAGISGTMRLRIVMKRNAQATSACENFAQGEVEDYTLHFAATSSKTDLSENETSPETLTPTLYLSPNPTSDQLNIEYQSDINTPNTAIRLYDLTGRLVFEETVLESINNDLDTQKATINIAHLPVGCYFVKIGNQTAKVVKY